ncbi:MAG: hypothetical protein ACE5D3_03190, partial [Candidatus Binatia bacterium]
MLTRKGARPKTKEDQQEEHREVEAIRKNYDGQIATLTRERLEKLVKLLDEGFVETGKSSD